MNIKRALKILIPLIFIILALLSVAIFTAFRNYRADLYKESLATDITQQIFERRLTGDDYLLHQTERSKIQWFSKQTALEKMVHGNAHRFSAAAEKPHIDQIKRSLQDSRKTFEHVVSSHETNKPGAFTQDKKTHFATQLTIKAQESINAATRLHETNHHFEQSALQQMAWLFLAAVLVLCAVLLVSFRIVWRSATMLDRRKAEDEAILGSIGDAVFAVNPKGRIILFNNMAERLTGYTTAEALNKPYDQILCFYNEKTGAYIDDFIIAALAGNNAAMAHHTILKHKNGSTLPVADSAAPIKHNGSILGAVVVFRDITQERELELMKDEFLSVASHELRTPMGAVRANISMILAGDYGPVSPALVEPLTDMKASTVRLVELVTDLLDVARLEAGRTKFSLQDFNIGEVVQSIVTSLAPLGKEKGVAIKIGQSNTASVQADPDKIRQILTNLVGNSLKFTDQGFISVSIKAGNDAVTVEVVDTGIGIDQSDQEKLFGKFKQISSAQDGKPAGTGLGLYISREMIRKMGGELWIKQSAPGQGSTFAFTLPRSQTQTALQIQKSIAQEATTHLDQK